jgi:hypothetical protein
MKTEHLLILLALAGLALLILSRCKKCEGYKGGKLGVAPGGACQPEMEECWSGFDCINGTCQQVGQNPCQDTDSC